MKTIKIAPDTPTEVNCVDSVDTQVNSNGGSAFTTSGWFGSNLKNWWDILNGGN